MPTPRFWKKKAILIKTEATYGVDPIPTGVANAIEVRNVSFTPMKNKVVEQNIESPHMGNQQEIVVGTSVTLNFDVAIAGSGAAGTAPAFGPLHLACGLSQTVSAGVSVLYNLISALFGSATIYINIDGVLHKMLGCRGDRDIKLTGAGIPVYSYKFTGLYGGIADAALPAVTMTAWQTPLAVNNVNTNSFSIDSFATNLYDLSIMGGNQVVHRDDIIGTEDVLITDRKMTGSVTIQAPAQADHDFYALVRAATVVPITITHGTVAGNKVKFDMLAQLKDPTLGEKNGVASMTLGLRLKPTSAGNDEFIETVM